MAPRPKYKEGRPKTYLVSARNIATLPFRLCNPPPSVGKVRSLSVVPLYNVRLDDVLNRKHLPPLGLKDFEEWLLFVELSPENLYFFLWLREYKRRYRQWKSQIEFKKTSYPNTILPDFQYSTHLAMFYSRAKQTFFTPGSEYELNLSSSALAPFHAADAPPYPDPETFIPIEIETRRMLDDSLRRFVQGQLSNMGNNRIICGIIVGIVICILGATPPLTVNFVLAHERWERLTALPGLWLGLWLIVASLNGVCLGIYLFGDLRQLRQFELARPSISKPIALPVHLPMRHGVSQSTNTSLPLHHHPKSPSNGGLRRVPSDSTDLTGKTARTPTTQRSIFDGHIQISQAYYDADEIDESAMYNDDDNNGDFADSAKDPYRFPDWSREDEDHPRERLQSFFSRDEDGNAFVSGDPGDSASAYTATAKFIHPFDLSDDDGYDEDAFERPQQHQRVDNFDFDLLPKRIRPRSLQNRTEQSSPASPATAVSKGAPFSVDHVARSSFTSIPTSIPSSPTSLMTPTIGSSPQPGLFFPPALKLRPPDPHAPPLAPPPTNLIAKFQEKCSIKRSRLQPGYLESERLYSDDDPKRPHSSSNYWTQAHKKDIDATSSNASVVAIASSVSTGVGRHFEESSSKGEKVRLRFKKISAVPPFKAPLTKILSPIIQRGQWEIVIRTGVIGFLLAWLIVGSLLAVPVVARR